MAKQNDPQGGGEAKQQPPSVVTPAEFAKIPLDFVIATPLLTTIEAHKVAAETTLRFVNELNDKSKNVKFETTVTETDENGKTQEKGKQIEVPLLSVVKVPSLNFDSLSVSFSYNISQVYKETNINKQAANLEVGTTGFLSSFINAKLSGSIEHTASRENTANRGGTLEVKVHVSESPLPPGLQKVINAITDNIGDPK